MRREGIAFIAEGSIRKSGAEKCRVLALPSYNVLDSGPAPGRMPPRRRISCFAPGLLLIFLIQLDSAHSASSAQPVGRPWKSRNDQPRRQIR
jgi:hypothetical protein